MYDDFGQALVFDVMCFVYANAMCTNAKHEARAVKLTRW